jgi:hypothetical protein
MTPSGIKPAVPQPTAPPLAPKSDIGAINNRELDIQKEGKTNSKI